MFSQDPIRPLFKACVRAFQKTVESAPAQNPSTSLSFSNRLNHSIPQKGKVVEKLDATRPELPGGRTSLSQRSLVSILLSAQCGSTRLTPLRVSPLPYSSLCAPNSGHGFELGRSAPRVPALPGSTSLPPGTAQAQAAKGPATVPEPKVAPVPSSPLPPRTMSPGPRLLLAAVLCLGLGALVSSSGSSGVRKRGPSVTDKVIQRLQQLLLQRARHSGRLGDRTAVAELEEKELNTDV